MSSSNSRLRLFPVNNSTRGLADVCEKTETHTNLCVYLFYDRTYYLQTGTYVATNINFQLVS